MKSSTTFGVLATLPLVLTSALSAPEVTLAGVVLSAILLRMTDVEAPEGTKFDERAEEAALKGAYITSSGNRATRLALGSVEILAAVLFASRTAKQPLVPSVPVLGIVLSWLGVLSLSFFGCIWVISGLYRQ